MPLPSFFENMFSGSPLSLKSAVSPTSPLDAEDAQSTRSALGFLGYGGDKKGDGGDLFSGLRAFQQDNGLAVDGVMNPDGPTARKLGEVLAEKRPQTPAVPQGETVDARLRSLMDDPRYADPTAPAGDALRTHVTRQFQKAYPGTVEYDGVGRMIRPQARILPEAVEPFDPDETLLWRNPEARILPDDAPSFGGLPRGHTVKIDDPWEVEPPQDLMEMTQPASAEDGQALSPDFLQGVRDTFRAGEERRRAEQAAQPMQGLSGRIADVAAEGGDQAPGLPPSALRGVRKTFAEGAAYRQGIAARDKGFRSGLGGGDQAAFEDTVKEIGALRDNDPKGYGLLSGETRAIYEKYRESREQYDRIAERRPGGATQDHRAQARKDAFDTTMHVGALRHIGSAVGEAMDDTFRQIGQSGRVLWGKGASPVPADGEGSDVPPGYRNSPIFGQVRGAVDLGAGMIPGLGALKGAGETAESFAGAGASPEAQRAAALGVAAVDVLGGKLVRKGGRVAVEGLDAAGMGLLKRMPPEILTALGLAADEVIDAGAKKGMKLIYNGHKEKRRSN